MVLQYFKSGPLRGLLICFSCIFLFMLLSSHWTYTTYHIISDRSLVTSNLSDTRASLAAAPGIERTTYKNSIIKLISQADVLIDPSVELYNISVLREDMIKGWFQFIVCRFIQSKPFVHFSSNRDFLFKFANKSSSDGSYNLPKTIHFVWTGKTIGEKYIKNIQTFVMNKDYEVF